MSKEELLQEFKKEVEQISKTDDAFEAWNYIVEFAIKHKLRSEDIIEYVPENSPAWDVKPAFETAIDAPPHSGRLIR